MACQDRDLANISFKGPLGYRVPYFPAELVKKTISSFKEIKKWVIRLIQWKLFVPQVAISVFTTQVLKKRFPPYIKWKSRMVEGYYFL